MKLLLTASLAVAALALTSLGASAADTPKTAATSPSETKHYPIERSL